MQFKKLNNLRSAWYLVIAKQPKSWCLIIFVICDVQVISPGLQNSFFSPANIYFSLGGFNYFSCIQRCLLKIKEASYQLQVVIRYPCQPPYQVQCFGTGSLFNLLNSIWMKSFLLKLDQNKMHRDCCHRKYLHHLPPTAHSLHILREQERERGTISVLSAFVNPYLPRILRTCSNA